VKLRDRPCECGERPVLRDGFYVCLNPECDGYGQVCSRAKGGGDGE
jgi:hypothetical protein